MTSKRDSGGSRVFLIGNGEGIKWGGGEKETKKLRGAYEREAVAARA